MAGPTSSVIGDHHTSTEPISLTVTALSGTSIEELGSAFKGATQGTIDALGDMNLNLASIKLGMQLVTEEELEPDAA